MEGRVSIVFALLTSWIVTGCTLVSDFDVGQCTSSMDCDVLTGEIQRCENSRCVPGCSDNAHCASVDPRLPLCQGPGGACVALFDEVGECTAVAGYDEEGWAGSSLNEVDVVGAFVSTLRSSAWLSLELAARAINTERTTEGTTDARPLLLVACSDRGDTVRYAMSHLIQDLGVSALVGPTSDDSLRAVLEQAVSAPAFVLTPAGSNGGASGHTDLGDLVWYLDSEYADTVPIYAQLLTGAIDVVRRRVPDPAAFKLASVVGNDAADEALADAVHGIFEVDGRNAEELTIDDRLRVIHPVDTAEPLPQQGVERLLGYAPALVLLFTGSRDQPPSVQPAAIIKRLEEDAAVNSAVPPLYIVGPRMAEDLPLGALVASRPSLRSRLIGVRGGPATDARLLAELRAGFAATYPEAAAQSAPFGVVPSAHDALYLISYALSAASRASARVSAEEVLGGFLRVTDAASGTPIEIGPGAERLGLGLSMLRGGGTVLLNGASGSNSFDAQTHTRFGSARSYVLTAEGTYSDSEPLSAFSGASDQPD